MENQLNNKEVLNKVKNNYGLRTMKEAFMLNYLLQFSDRWISPTEIGEAYNGGHSSTSSKVLLRLVQKDLAIRSEKGHYKPKNIEI